MIGSYAHADTVNYTLDNVILSDNNAQMTGRFSWTYDNIDEFGDGRGAFSYLYIPFTLHDHTDLEASFDVGNSIEITFPGNVHDDGVDITLFLVEPLTPTGSASVDLVRSKFEIGGNGFHDGVFLSGVISPATSGDTDGDHDVDDADYGNLVAQFGGAPGFDGADFNNDNRVDLRDFAIQRANFGFGVTSAPASVTVTTVPEPVALILTAGGLPLLLKRRRLRLCRQ
jgi:hypothetical protein